MTRQIRPIHLRRSRRHAATLTEILMALMVMGIGLVSVISLFPLSLLRSVEATKLTNATLLRQNAEAIIKASVTTEEPPTIPPPPDWIPTVNSSALVQDPDGNGKAREHRGERFVVDPLGAWMMAGDGTATWLNGPGSFTAFGDLNGDGTINNLDNYYDTDRDGTADRPIKRYGFGLASRGEAEALVTLPDSYITLFDGLAGTFSVGTDRMTVTASDSSLGEYVGSSVRVTVIDSTNHRSYVEDANVEGPNVFEIVRPIPPRIAHFDRVLVEVPERRFTWLATVRRSGLSPSVSVATFFRRSYDPEDEKVFSLIKPVGTYNTYFMPLASQNPPIVGNSISGYDNLPPGFEVGNWMFDFNTFRWWKIAAIQGPVNIPSVGMGYRIATDPEEIDIPIWRAPSGQVGVPIKAIFPRNIVEVFTLSKE